MAFSYLANLPFATLDETTHRWVRTSSLFICDVFWLTAFHNGNHRIGGVKVNSNYFAHEFIPPRPDKCLKISADPINNSSIIICESLTVKDWMVFIVIRLQGFFGKNKRGRVKIEASTPSLLSFRRREPHRNLLPVPPSPPFPAP